MTKETKQDNVRMFYLRDSEKKPVVLVATDTVDDSHIVYAVAIHNPKDSFDRAMAHTVVLGRLKKLKEEPGRMKFPIAQGVRGKIVEDILKRSSIDAVTGKPLDRAMSARANQAAEIWLKSYQPQQKMSGVR
jgi:hypothetical protein